MTSSARMLTMGGIILLFLVNLTGITNAAQPVYGSKNSSKTIKLFYPGQGVILETISLQPKLYLSSNMLKL